MAISGLTSTPLQASTIQPSVAESSDPRLEEIRRVIGDESGKYSLSDKAKAYRHFAEFMGDLTVSVKDREQAVSILDNSSFFKEANKVQQRNGEFLKHQGQGNDRAIDDGIIGFYDSLEPWQKELPDFYDLRDYWSVAKEIQGRIEDCVRAGAYKYGDQDPTDPEAKALLALFKEVNRGEKFNSYEARRGYLRDVLATLRQTAPGGLERVDLIDLSDQARAHLGVK